ncbi:MAG: hypothetical protein AB7O73_05685 [Bacteroidia bacterium]
MTEINPFFARASEYIELDDKFLNLFSPEVLNIFNQGDSKIWNNVTILRSSPGGGKTTLLKMFTPQILKKLKETSKHDEHNREIFVELKKIGVYDDDGNVKVIGSLVPFNNEYVSIEFLNLNDTQKIRIFFSLVNIRIILSVFQSISIINEFKSIEDYKRISFDFQNNLLLPTAIRKITTGFELFNWACDQEEIICKEIDSVQTNQHRIIEGTDNLFALDLLAPNNLSIDGQKIKERILVMLDDVHNLSAFQRTHLVTTIIQKRPSVNTWISERLKALTMDELFSEGNTEGRDMTTIHIEKFWSKKYVAFEKFAKSVANRRIALALDTPREFASYLMEDFDEEEKAKITAAIEIVKNRILSTYGNSDRYKVWIDNKENITADLYEKLSEWRSLEVLLFRDSNKAQQRLSLDDEDSLQEEELKAQQGSDVRTAAQLFINKEFQIPFYFGISKVCRLSSFNIEQFLLISGQLFEEIKNNEIKRVVNSNYRLEISPKKQESIIKNVVNKIKWNELTNKVPNFSKIKIFLDSIGEFCNYETHLPNAWNSPGLNAVAILMTDRVILKDEALKDKNHPYYALAKCIADCISYNLIDFELNYNCKNKTWMLLYLNKMYCAKYNLPMNNGGFKEKKLTELLGWFNNGFKPKGQNKMAM